MSCQKKVAILLATYNGENYIIEQLESISNQTYREFKVYIHDDGSKDSTVDLVREFCLSDSRFHLIDSSGFGSAKENFFFLMKNVNDEEYVMFSDQDDCWNCDKVEITINAMNEANKEDDYVCVFSDLEVVDSNLQTINPSFYTYSGKNPYKKSLPSLIMNNVVVGCTMMVNRALLKKGLEDVPHELIFMHDWWLALIASASGKMIYIDRPLIKYRQHATNVVGANMKKKFGKRIIDQLFFKNFKTNRARMKRSVDFSKALDLVIDDSDYKTMIHQMANVYNHCWLYRARFFIKHGLIPYSKIWKIMWL